MIEIHKTYSWNNHTAYVTAVYGDVVYYVDQYYCYFRKSVASFTEMYCTK